MRTNPRDRRKVVDVQTEAYTHGLGFARRDTLGTCANKSVG